MTPALSLLAPPVMGINVLEGVGVEEPVGDTVVVFEAWFKAKQILGTRVEKAETQHQLKFMLHGGRLLLCSSAGVQVEFTFKQGWRSALIVSLLAQ